MQGHRRADGTQQPQVVPGGKLQSGARGRRERLEGGQGRGEAVRLTKSCMSYSCSPECLLQPCCSEGGSL